MFIEKSNSKKGITLIELLIVLGLLSMVLVVLTSFFIFELKTFSRGNEQSEIQADARIASDYIQKQVRYITSAELLTSPDDEDEYDYLYFDTDGKLIHKVWNTTTETWDTRYQSSFLLPDSEFTLDDSELSFIAKNDTQAFAVSTKILLPNLFLDRNTAISSTNTALKFQKPGLIAGSSTPPPPPAIPLAIQGLTTPTTTITWSKNSQYSFTATAEGGSGTNYVYSFTNISGWKASPAPSTSGGTFSAKTPNENSAEAKFTVTVTDSSSNSISYDVVIKTPAS